MIFDILFQWISGLVQYVMGLVEVPTLPPYVTQGASGISDILASGAKLCNWLPVEHFGGAIAAVFAFWFAGLMMRIALMVVNVIRGAGL